MAIDGFDYKSFAENMYEQLITLVPDEFSDEDKRFVSDTILKFSKIAGEALDEANEFNSEQAFFILGIIANWTYYECFSVVKAEIPEELRLKTVSNVIEYIFDVATDCIRKGMTKDDISDYIARVGNEKYDECVKQLPLNSEKMQKALEQSTWGTSKDICISQSKWSIASWGIFHTCVTFMLLIAYKIENESELLMIALGFAIIALYYYINAIFNTSEFISVDKDKCLYICEERFGKYKVKNCINDRDILNFQAVSKSPLPYYDINVILTTGDTVNLFNNSAGNMNLFYKIQKLLVENYPNRAFTEFAFKDENFSDYFKTGKFELFYRLPIFVRCLIVSLLVLIFTVGILSYYVTHIKEISEISFALFAAVNIIVPFLVFLLILYILDRKKLSGIPGYVKGFIIVFGIIFLYLFLHFTIG